MSLWVIALGLMTGCKNARVETRPMAGTIEEPLPMSIMPEQVQQAMDKATKFHTHELLCDSANEIAVHSIDEMDEASSEGYGIQVTKGATSTIFPHIRNTRQPQARYNTETQTLWLTSSAMEGTGVHVEWLHQIRFGENEIAQVTLDVNPYSVQQELLKRLRYTIEGDVVTFYDGEQLLATATNTINDMGGFDEEQPVWIGEQLYYDLSGDEPKVVFTPGIKFTTGLVLTYDDMPDLSAPISFDENGNITLHEISTNQRPADD